MAQAYAAIGVANRSVAEVRDAIRAEFGPDTLSVPLLGLRVDVVDVAEAHRYAAEFLAAHDMVEPDPVWRGDDAAAFAVEVTIGCSRGRATQPLIEAVAEVVSLP